MTEKEIRKSLSGYRGIQSIREIELLRLLDEKDAQIAALAAPPAQPTAQATEPVAPDILAALRDLMTELAMSAQRPSVAVQNRARAAIAKAEQVAQASAEPVAAWTVRDNPDQSETDVCGPAFDVMLPSGEWETCHAVSPNDARECTRKSWEEDQQKLAEYAAPVTSAEPFSWQATTPCYTRFVTDAKYQQFSPAVQKWYRPICTKCGHPAASAAPAAPSVSADPLQELVDQAQALDMGYGPNACPTCGKLASAALVVQEPLSDSAIIDLCEMSNIHWLNPDDEEDGFPGSFDMASMAQMRNLLSGTVAAQVVPEGWQEVIEALKCYADGHHFTLHTPEAWDTVSGEPVNFQEDEACTATVEDGSVAKMALDKIAAAPKEPTT